MWPALRVAPKLLPKVSITSGRFLTFSKNGCFMQSSKVILSCELKTKHLYRRSRASSGAAGKIDLKSFLGLF